MIVSSSSLSGCMFLQDAACLKSPLFVNLLFCIDLCFWRITAYLVVEYYRVVASILAGHGVSQHTTTDKSFTR